MTLRVRILLAFCGVIFLLSLGAYWVGFFNDDAFYIIGARSLLQGRYAELNGPGEPPLTSYMPGYSLLLAPIAALSAGALWPYQVFSIMLTLGSLGVLARYFAREVPAEVLLAALAISGLNPLTVSMSGAVLSDIPFLFFTALIFWSASRNWEAKGLRGWAVISALIGFSVLVRPNGAAFILALTLCLFLEKKWKPAIFIAASASVPGALFLLRNYFHTGRSITYVSEMASPYAANPGALAAGLELAWRNLSFYVHEFFLRTLFRWPELPLPRPLLSALTVVVGLAAVAAGARAEGNAGWRKFVRFYLLFYVLGQLVWIKQAGRYLFPILPFLVFYFFRGIAVLGGRKAVWAAAGASLMLCLSPVAHILASASRNRGLRHGAFEWIRENTRPDAIFAAKLDGQLYLHTGRTVFQMPDKLDADWLKAHPVDYVLDYSTDFIMPVLFKEKIKSPPDLSGLGSPVYEDKTDGSRIYRVAQRR